MLGFIAALLVVLVALGVLSLMVQVRAAGKAKREIESLKREVARLRDALSRHEAAIDAHGASGRDSGPSLSALAADVVSIASGSRRAPSWGRLIASLVTLFAERARRRRDAPRGVPQ